MATGSAMFLIKGNDLARHLYVPISYDSVVISGALPATCYAHVRSKAGASIESPIATFDVIILDQEGEVIIEIGDFSVRQINDSSLLENAKHSPGAEPANTPGFEEVEEGETTHTLDAISSEEGGRAFQRVLANPRVSNVVIFPSDFSAYVDSLRPRHSDRAPAKIVAAPPVNPDEEVEVTMTRWWKELLGVTAVGTQDDFFELGGQSLTGVRLLAKVKKKYGVDLKLATLFSATTIEQLSALVRKQTAPRSSFHSLVPIQTKGTKPPLFVIHGMGGNVLGFRDLTQNLESDQPVYGVEYSIGESSPVLLRMEDLATRYLQEIRRLQPNGPYYLLGYSFGGLLAFEMAQQLHAAGQEVGLLGMLDTFLMNGFRAPAEKRPLWKRLKTKTAGLGGHAWRLMFGPERRGYLKEDLTDRIDAIIGQGRQFIYGVLRARGRSIPKFLHRAKDVNWFAATRYEALPYPGRVTLFRAATPESFIDTLDPDLGWRSLAGGGVEIHEIPGTHRKMMREPNVRILAREVGKTLASAYGGHFRDSNLVRTEQEDGDHDGKLTDEVEVQLARWWEELLGVKRVGRSDNFFDLGGESLTGVRLLAKLRKTYGIDLKLSALFEAPTVEQLALLVRGEATPKRFSSVAPIRTHKSAPPLFFLQGLGGEVLGFIRRHIGI